MKHDTDTTDAPERPSDWYLADGTPYRGEPFEDADGKPFGEAWISCGHCKGSGKWRRGRRFGSCRTCGGDKEVWEQVRIYTPGQIASKQRQKERAAAKREENTARRDAERAERWQVFVVDKADLIERARASGDKFCNEVLAKAELYGSLTEGQERAIEAKLARIADDLASYGASSPVAQPGERIEIEVTCRARGSFMAKGFGRRRGSREVFVTEMIDDHGNAIKSVTENFKLNPGDRALIKGTVKEHDNTRKPWMETILVRIVLLDLKPAPAPGAAAEAPAPEEDPEEEYAPSMGM